MLRCSEINQKSLYTYKLFSITDERIIIDVNQIKRTYIIYCFFFSNFWKFSNDEN